eukprot:gene15404-28680_t
MAQLPAAFNLQQWRMSVCSVDGVGKEECSDATVDLYAPDVKWYSCTLANGRASIGCVPGGLLRVFGRQLAYDTGIPNSGCRAVDSTVPFEDGNALLLQLAPVHPPQKSGPAPPSPSPSSSTTPSTPSTTTIAAAEQSCYSATFILPSSLSAGEYTLTTATSVGGDRGAFTAPTDVDVQTVRIAAGGATLGTTVFRPAAGARDGAAITAALNAAAAHAGGGVVQLEAADYTVAASTTFAVAEGVTLKGASKENTRLLWGKQTPATGYARRKLGLIHGGNTTRVGWALEDLTIVAPQQDWMSFYMASATVADCGGAGTYVDGSWRTPLTPDGFNAPTPRCAGMTMSRVAIVMDRVCAPGTAWPATQFENVSCGGYTNINKTSTKPATASSNGIPPALQLFGSSAVVQDSEFTHYGTCGSNVAFAIQVANARHVVLRRNVLHYGCSAYGFASSSALVFESNVLLPYKNASGGGSNVDTFGSSIEMTRMYYANNTQELRRTGRGEHTPPSHLETMTLDAGTGLYEGKVVASASTSCRRTNARVAAALVLSGDGAGQWRRAVQHGTKNTTWSLARPFDSGGGNSAGGWNNAANASNAADTTANASTLPLAPLTQRPLRAPALSSSSFVQVGKLEGQLLFIGNYWGGSHFQLYGMCLDCVVAENVFNSSFAASWGRNPHNIFGGWQPNFQVEWMSNTVVGGTGPLNWRIVLRGNRFHGGGGLQLGINSSFAQTAGNVLVDSNIL